MISLVCSGLIVGFAFATARVGVSEAITGVLVLSMSVITYNTYNEVTKGYMIWFESAKGPLEPSVLESRQHAVLEAMVTLANGYNTIAALLAGTSAAALTLIPPELKVPIPAGECGTVREPCNPVTAWYARTAWAGCLCMSFVAVLSASYQLWIVARFPRHDSSRLHTLFEALPVIAWVFPLPTFVLLWAGVLGLTGSLFTAYFVMQLSLGAPVALGYPLLFLVVIAVAMVVTSCRTLDRTSNCVYGMVAPGNYTGDFTDCGLWENGFERLAAACKDVCTLCIQRVQQPPLCVALRPRSGSV